ncbi:uncharacterized protein EV420DRAFT_871739 [Desarmillaria tabescens]|uniref:F-box domain-containing protein n=1 Tax=Armillaria tabescens TaxID=1929756 RepID=A0AA39JVL5_ARMTA|nr:uncharacterized protein EV420DRAFT_871739 [Desarmillaria tabescens]KAK0447388.1 hypothetical protein EV420DRAFT_871739 [Desarmillaria tabescens]
MDSIPSIEQELFELHIGITTAANHFHRCITQCETFSPLILSTYLPAISFRRLGLPSMTNFDALRVHTPSEPAKAGAIERTSANTGRPVILPSEIYDLIFHYLDRSELAAVAFGSKSFHCIATRVLYPTITLKKPIESICCLRTIASNKSLASLVRSFKVDWADLKSPTSNFYALAQRALRNLTNLNALTLELPRRPPWIIDDCTFRLKEFSSSYSWQPKLAHFIESQPTLTAVTLHGLDGLSLAAFEGGMFRPQLAIGFNQLDATAVPNLTSLRAIHATPELLSLFLRGRPVRTCSVPVYPDSVLETLDALMTTSVAIEKLSLMSFDAESPGYLFVEVAKRFPQLKALHVLLLRGDYSEEILDGISPVLRAFKQLEYLTFMAQVPLSGSAKYEHKIATQWHLHCPSLKTIILPEGKMWFKTS